MKTRRNTAHSLEVEFKPLPGVESYSPKWQDMDNTKPPLPYDKWGRARLAREESSAVESGSNFPTDTEGEQSEPLGSPNPRTLTPRASERLTELMNIKPPPPYDKWGRARGVRVKFSHRH